MMTPSFPPSILVGSMKRTDKKMGSKDNKGHSLKDGFWQELTQAWKWLNIISMPLALVFVIIMIVVEAVNSNPVMGVVLGLATIAAAEAVCTITAFLLQVMFLIFDWFDK